MTYTKRKTTDINKDIYLVKDAKSGLYREANQEEKVGKTKSGGKKRDKRKTHKKRKSGGDGGIMRQATEEEKIMKKSNKRTFKRRMGSEVNEPVILTGDLSAIASEKAPAPAAAEKAQAQAEKAPAQAEKAPAPAQAAAYVSPIPRPKGPAVIAPANASVKKQAMPLADTPIVSFAEIPSAHESDTDTPLDVYASASSKPTYALASSSTEYALATKDNVDYAVGQQAEGSFATTTPLNQSNETPIASQVSAEVPAPLILPEASSNSSSDPTRQIGSVPLNKPFDINKNLIPARENKSQGSEAIEVSGKASEIAKGLQEAVKKRNIVLAGNQSALAELRAAREKPNVFEGTVAAAKANDIIRNTPLPTQGGKKTIRKKKTTFKKGWTKALRRGTSSKRRKTTLKKGRTKALRRKTTFKKG